MTPYEIPLEASPQVFQIQLGGATYSLATHWCDPQEAWLLSISSANGTTLLLEVPLQPGVDLLAQYAHLGIPGQLWVQTDGDINATPGYKDLGTSGHLYYLAP